MNLTIIGTGYVGLVSGVCLALKGHKVVCVDLRHEVVEMLNAAQPHIFENGLPEALKEVVSNGNFLASTDLNAALDHSELVMIAVGTPSEKGEIDLSQIQKAGEQIGLYLKTESKYISVVIKSTVVPTTTDTFLKNTIETTSGKTIVKDFGLGMNPEFLREGNAMADFLEPDRVVIGSEDEITKQRLHELYQPWECDKIFVNTRTAEMIKYVNNTILASLISLSNELANHAANIGDIDYLDVLEGISADKRWSPILEDGRRVRPSILDYMIPGVGFGGSCFPKDVQALRTHGIKSGESMKIMNAVLDVNDTQPLQAVKALKRQFPDLKNKHILVLGLAFKPDTDDIRESTAIKIINELLESGAKITAHDPIAIENTVKVLPEIAQLNYTNDWQSVLALVDIIIVATNWTEYTVLKQLDFEGALLGKMLFDSKRLFRKIDFNSADYFTIGYQPV